MSELDVKHFLGIYRGRKEMQDLGITNPEDAIKEFTAEFVEKLSQMPLDEEVRIEGNSFFDSKGTIIATIPKRNIY